MIQTNSMTIIRSRLTRRPQMESEQPTTSHWTIPMAIASQIYASGFGVPLGGLGREEIDGKPQITGEVMVSIELDKRYKDVKMRYYFWVTNTASTFTVVDHDPNIPDPQTLRVYTTTPPTDGLHLKLFFPKAKHITVSQDGTQATTEMDLLYNVDSILAVVPQEVCANCEHASIQPQLGVVVFSTTPRPPSEENNPKFVDQWQFLGAAKVPFLPSQSTVLRNIPLEVFELDINQFGNTIGSVGRVLTTTKLHPDSQKITSLPELRDMTEWARKKGLRDEVERSKPHYKNADNLRIQQPFIGGLFDIYPRSLYYENALADHLLVTPEWIAAQVLMSLKMAGFNSPEEMVLMAYHDVDLDGRMTLKTHNTMMHIIIRAFTLFVTRYSYVLDVMPLGKHDAMSYEAYTGPILAGTGSYDCEDGAWFLYSIFRHIQNLPDETIQATDKTVRFTLLMARAMLKGYVPCSALVDVVNPCLFKMKASDKEKACYHQTCMLIPKNSLSKMLGKPESYHDIKYEEPLTVLFAESTCMVYADPWTPLVSTEKDLKFKNITHLVLEGKEVLAVPIYNNLPFWKNPFYGKVIGISSDFYNTVDKGNKSIKCTELQLSCGEYPRADEKELERFDQLQCKQLGFDPKEEPEVRQLMASSKAWPHFMLDINFDEFNQRLQKVKPRKPSLTGIDLCQGYICSKKECMSREDAMPYLGWNLTNQASADDTPFTVHFHFPN